MCGRYTLCWCGHGGAPDEKPSAVLSGLHTLVKQIIPVAKDVFDFLAVNYSWWLVIFMYNQGRKFGHLSPSRGRFVGSPSALSLAFWAL